MDSTIETSAQARAEEVPATTLLDLPAACMEAICHLLLGRPSTLVALAASCRTLQTASQPAVAQLNTHRKAWRDSCPMTGVRGGQQLDEQFLKRVLLPWGYPAVSQPNPPFSVGFPDLSAAQRKLIHVRCDQVGLRSNTERRNYYQGEASVTVIRPRTWAMDWNIKTVNVTPPRSLRRRAHGRHASSVMDFMRAMLDAFGMSDDEDVEEEYGCYGEDRFGYWEEPLSDDDY